MNDCPPVKQRIVDVTKGFISGWSLPMVISSVVDNADGTYKLIVDKTYYLQSGKYRILTIDSVDYTITEVENNDWVMVSGDSLPVAQTITLPPPMFVHGTIIQTNEEVHDKNNFNVADVTPMIFLRRPFTQTNDAGKENTDIAVTAPLVFYFLNEADFENWSTEEHDKHAVVPMNNMVEEFIELLKNKPKLVGRPVNYNTTDLIKFGFVIDKGYQNGGLFSNNYSGVELEIEMEFKYACICP